jgi:hypothetical protein
MDRGVPTEEVLEEMRAADPPVHYLVGTPKGRLTRLEKHLVTRPWQEARPGVQVKLLAQEGELYVLAQSRDRVAKERAMRRRQLKRLWARLRQISTMQLTREELLMKLGAARDQQALGRVCVSGLFSTAPHIRESPGQPILGQHSRLLRWTEPPACFELLVCDDGRCPDRPRHKHDEQSKPHAYAWTSAVRGSLLTFGTLAIQGPEPRATR